MCEGVLLSDLLVYSTKKIGVNASINLRYIQLTIHAQEVRFGMQALT